MAQAAAAAQACAQCGACQAVCPLYRATRQEEVSARGKLRLIGAMAKGWLAPGRDLAKALDVCLLCGRCSQKCPNQTPATQAQRAAREVLAPLAGRLSAQALFVDDVLADKSRLEALAKAGRWLWPADAGLSLRLPGLEGLEKLPRPAARFFLQDAPKIIHGPKGRPTVAFFVGCLANYLRPELARQAVTLLARRFTVVIPPGQGCCGLMAHGAGHAAAARALVQAGMRAFAGADMVVTACASCAHAIASAWPELLDGPAAEQAQTLAGRVVEISGVLAEAGGVMAADPGRVAALHVPCHQSVGLADGPSPGRLLVAAGVELAAMDGHDQCCGGGGLFSLRRPALSRAVFAPRRQTLADSGARVLATSCSGCFVQWRRGLPAEVAVLHPVELLR